jgi:hypothetical protein
MSNKSIVPLLTFFAKVNTIQPLPLPMSCIGSQPLGVSSIPLSTGTPSPFIRLTLCVWMLGPG